MRRNLGKDGEVRKGGEEDARGQPPNHTTGCGVRRKGKKDI